MLYLLKWIYLVAYDLHFDFIVCWSTLFTDGVFFVAKLFAVINKCNLVGLILMKNVIMILVIIMACL